MAIRIAAKRTSPAALLLPPSKGDFFNSRTRKKNKKLDGSPRPSAGEGLEVRGSARLWIAAKRTSPAALLLPPS